MAQALPTLSPAVLAEALADPNKELWMIRVPSNVRPCHTVECAGSLSLCYIVVREDPCVTFVAVVHATAAVIQRAGWQEVQVEIKGRRAKLSYRG